MAGGITEQEFNLLRDYIEESCGIALGDEKAYLIETRLTKLMAMNGCDDFGAFYRLARNDTKGVLRDKIIDAMTTNETLWFRDKHPFTIMKELMLPDLAQKLQAGKIQKARIWSGASSTGQEAYSMAMTIHEFCKLNPAVNPDQFEIIGTDISASALFIAKAGRYDFLAMDRGLEATLKMKYFRQDGRVWEIDESLKKMVTFQKFNLQDSLATLGQFDIVFLRYVAIYFSEDFKRDLFARIHRTLRDPGYFVIGAIESLRGLSDNFQRKAHVNGNYYTTNGL